MGWLLSGGSNVLGEAVKKRWFICERQFRKLIVAHSASIVPLQSCCAGNNGVNEILFPVFVHGAL